MDELAQTLKVPPSTLRRRITYWQGQGLIRESTTDVFKLIEEGPMRRMSGVSGKKNISFKNEQCVEFLFSNQNLAILHE